MILIINFKSFQNFFNNYSNNIIIPKFNRLLLYFIGILDLLLILKDEMQFNFILRQM